MKKKTVTIVIIFSLVGILLFLVYKKQNNNNLLKNKISSLPNMTFKSLQNRIWKTSELRDAIHSIIINFKPNCDHCQYQLKYAKEVVKEKDVFIIFVANVSIQELKEFLIKNDIQDERNIIFLSDEENNFSKTFHTNVFPSIFIYGKDKKLKKRFNGETKAEAILKYLE